MRIELCGHNSIVASWIENVPMLRVEITPHPERLVATASGILHVRIDAAARGRLDIYAKSNGMTTSQAARAALAVGLREAEEKLDAAFSRQAFREGLIAGEQKILEAMRSAVNTITRGK
jgi:hypothetical protein